MRRSQIVAGTAEMLCGRDPYAGLTEDGLPREPLARPENHLAWLRVPDRRG